MRDFAEPEVSYAERPTGAGTLSDQRELARLNAFFVEVGPRALRIAEIGVRDRDEAHDIVQEAMLRLARRYAHKPPAEWTPLFYRILKNRVRDFHRRQKVQRGVFAFFGRGAHDETYYDPVAAAPDPAGRAPDETLASDEAMRDLEHALRRLPPRQLEAFVLRTFEGLDTAGTAAAMGVSQGSVKTHYFRALNALREMLGEHDHER